MKYLKKKLCVCLPLFFPPMLEKITQYLVADGLNKISYEDYSDALFACELGKIPLSYQDYLDELNKTEVYVIVNSSKKKNKHNLILIQSQERLSGEKSLDRARFAKIFLKSRQQGYHAENWHNPKTAEFYRGMHISRMVRTNIGSGLAEYFRGGKFYFPKNLGGYKSICPVFFDPESAKIFLLNVYEEGLEILLGLPYSSKRQISAKKEFLRKILKTKIISIGLGDFLEFYSDSSKNLEKTEFLFFPTYENLEDKFGKITMPFRKKGVIFENFSSYQEKLLSYKKDL